jgi:hypothetical protein
MGPKPSPSHTIERKKNHLGYTPANCIWLPAARQARNRSSVRMFRVDSISLTATECAVKAGMSLSGFLDRIDKHKLTAKAAIITPYRGVGRWAK